MKPQEVAIAGCGPGGLAAALFLRCAGHRVVIYERFETPQPVGSGLMVQPSGLAVLDALGLGGTLRTLAAPIRGLHGLSMPSQRLALSMSYAAIDPEMMGYGVHRALLFDLLYEAARKAGIGIECGRAVIGSETLSGGRRRLAFNTGNPSPGFDLVIDAMGSRSLLSRQSHDLDFGALWAVFDRVESPGFMPDWLDQRYFRARQMAGILPLGRSAPARRNSVAYFWSLRGADLDQWHRDGLEIWREQALNLWPESEPLLSQLIGPEQFVFASYQHRTLPKPFDTALVHIGDAWHATSPQLGQGANMALLDAAALSAAMEASASVADALSRFHQNRRRHVWLYQLLSNALTPVFQSENRLLPLMRDLMMKPLDQVPLVRRLAARLVAGQVMLRQADA